MKSRMRLIKGISLLVGCFAMCGANPALAVDSLTAKAILGENGNLNFVYDSNEYIKRDSYTDNLGETIISEVYSVPADATTIEDIGWANSNLITATNFDSTFGNFLPVSTAYWFAGVSNLASVTGLENLNTLQTNNMSNMFSETGSDVAIFVIDLSNLLTGSVTNMSNMFYHTGYGSAAWSIGDIKGWNVGTVTNMSSMFEGIAYNAAGNVSLNLSGWVTQSLTDTSRMFANAKTLRKVFVGEGWNTKAITESNNMFVGATALVGGNETVYSTGHLTHEYARIDSESHPGYFSVDSEEGYAAPQGVFSKTGAKTPAIVIAVEILGIVFVLVGMIIYINRYRKENR